MTLKQPDKRMALFRPTGIPVRSWVMLGVLLLGLGSFLCACTFCVVTNAIGSDMRFCRLTNA
jgi:hypothetical protein